MTNWTDVGIGKTGRIILKAKKVKAVALIRLQIAESNKYPLSDDRILVKARDNNVGQAGLLLILQRFIFAWVYP